jgi:type I restriction enzyme S subunit
MIGLRQARVVPIGSAIVCCIGTIGKVAFADQDLTTNQQINSVIFDKHEQWLGRYGTYSLIASGEEHKRMSNRVVVSILNKSQQGHIKMPLPDILSQTKIADFLDVKTSRFDSIISKKEKLIEKLEEAKKSLISEVVTGKVKIVDGQMVERSPEEMKDSGIEWLGMIPKDWKLMKIKNLAVINPPKSELPKCAMECTFMPMVKLRRGLIDTDEQKPIEEVYDGYTYFRENDIIMAKVTPCYENGNIAIAKGLKNGIGFGTTEINVFRAQAISTEFLYYRLQESHLMNYGVSHMTGVAGLQRVPTSYFSEFKFAVPGWREQKSIEAFLETTLSEMSSIQNNVRNQIDKLQQAKQSLIYEAVTGKIDLRDWETKQEGE